MKEQVILRQETKDDFKEVFEVNQIAFRQDNEAKLVNALRNNPDVFMPELSLVAPAPARILSGGIYEPPGSPL